MVSEARVATIHLIEGPVGAGKSTFAARLSVAHEAPHLNLDEWIVTFIFSGPAERRPRGVVYREEAALHPANMASDV